MIVVIADKKIPKALFAVLMPGLAKSRQLSVGVRAG